MGAAIFWEGQRNLNEMEKVLPLVLQATDVGICRVDNDGRCIFVNRAAAAMLGHQPDELVGKPLHELVHHTRADGQHCPQEECPIIQAIADGRGARFEEEVFWRKDGMRLWVDCTTHPLGPAGLNSTVVAFSDISERKRREDDLHALNAALENAVEGISRLDVSGRYLSVNPSYAQTLGYSQDEMLGLYWEQTVHPDDLELARAAYRRMLEFGKAEVELRGLRKDGELFHKQVTIVKAHGAKGEFLGHHCFMRDITERTLAAEALHREQEFIKAVLESIEEPIIACDAQGVLTLFNRATREMIGRDVEPVSPYDCSQHYFLYDADGQSLLGAEDLPLMRALRGEHIRNAEVVVKPGSRNHRLLIAARPLKDSAGKLIGAVAACQDITEQREALEAQRKFTQEFDALLRQLQLQIRRMPLAYVLFDADLRIVDWNPAAQRIFGYRKDEALGMAPPFEKLVPPEGRPQVEEVLRRIRRGDMAAHSEVKNLTKDGAKIVCQWFNTPIMTDDGQFGGLMCLVQDVTERRRLEERLQQAQKMEAVGQLAGGVAHDFNNLLTIINGYSEVVADSIPPDSPHREPLEEIRKAGERAASLTRQLLAFSRRQVMTPKVLNINDVVHDTERMLRRVISEDVQLRTVLSVCPGQVRADPGQLAQVLLNLAVNARDAMPQGGLLTIETANVEVSERNRTIRECVPPGSYVRLSVADTGVGMTEEVRRRVFEPFFTTKGLGKGTGLGLPVVQGIVAQSEGYIEIESHLGKGTCFQVFLPRVDRAIRSEQESSSAAPPPCGVETILLVEDEPSVRALTRRVLQSCGYRVLEAANGDEALRLAVQLPEPIHLLMTDVVMPGMDGRTLAERLHDQRPDIKVLYMSGYTNDTIVRRGVSQEQLNYLQKPYSPAVLAHKVREVLTSSV